MANHNSICSLSVDLQRLTITQTHANPNLPEELDKTRGLRFKLNPVSCLFSHESWTQAPFACVQYVCVSDKGVERENTRKWPNISTVGGLQLVPHEWGLWLRSEESRSVAVPMLPYQYCREKKEGRKEWMVIGPGTDTPNKTKNRQCVWSGMQFTLIYVNIYILMNALTPRAKWHLSMLCVRDQSVVRALRTVCV